MGGNNNRQNKKASSSPFAVFNIFKAKRSSSRMEDSRDSMRAYRVYPSDEDRGRYVAEPGIDRKASAYIDRFRAANQHVAEHDHLRQAATPVSNYN